MDKVVNDCYSKSQSNLPVFNVKWRPRYPPRFDAVKVCFFASVWNKTPLRALSHPSITNRYSYPTIVIITLASLRREARKHLALVRVYSWGMCYWGVWRGVFFRGIPPARFSHPAAESIDVLFGDQSFQRIHSLRNEVIDRYANAAMRLKRGCPELNSELSISPIGRSVTLCLCLGMDPLKEIRQTPKPPRDMFCPPLLGRENAVIKPELTETSAQVSPKSACTNIFTTSEKDSGQNLCPSLFYRKLTKANKRPRIVLDDDWGSVLSNGSVVLAAAKSHAVMVHRRSQWSRQVVVLDEDAIRRYDTPSCRTQLVCRYPLEALRAHLLHPAAQAKPGWGELAGGVGFESTVWWRRGLHKYLALNDLD